MSDNGTPRTDRLGALKQTKSKPGEAEPDEDFPCFGCVRGNRRAFNIELRRLQGSWPAPEYAWLHYAEWCPCEKSFSNSLHVGAGSIVLHYESGQTVVVAGRNLRQVHQRILEHQVKYIAEAEQTATKIAADEEVIVNRIEIVECKEVAQLNVGPTVTRGSPED